MGAKASVFPVFSTFGELAHQEPITERERWLAIFCYQSIGNSMYWENLRKAIAELRPDRIIALGRNSDIALVNLPDVKLKAVAF